MTSFVFALSLEDVLCILIGLAIGSFIAGIASGFVRAARADGTIYIDRSNPEKDVYRLELNSLSDLEHKRYVVFKVDNLSSRI